MTDESLDFYQYNRFIWHQLTPVRTLRLTSTASLVSQYTLISSLDSRTVLPTSEITNELPPGTGILLAIATDPVEVTPTLLSKSSTVTLTLLLVLFEKVPPTKIVLVDSWRGICCCRT